MANHKPLCAEAGIQALATRWRTAWTSNDGIKPWRELVSVAGVAAEHRFALQDMARSRLAVQRGRGDHDAQRSMEASRQRKQQRKQLGQHRGLGLGR